MTNHYYSRNQSIESKPLYWDYRLRDHIFQFKTDQGVFSKKEVDFGSRMLIEKFALPTIDGPILDVGCGYGPIGLALAKVFPNRTVHMVDINKRALHLAKENANLNQITNVEIYESDRFEQVKTRDFAAIVTNPPIRAGKRIVHDIFSESYQYLQRKGALWAVIQKKQGAPSAQKKLKSVFQHVEVVQRSKGYYVLKAEKF